jgi:hypothetical protein
MAYNPNRDIRALGRAHASANRANEQRYSQILGELSGMGQAQSQRIDQGVRIQSAMATQGLRNRGLGNSTVIEPIQRQIHQAADLSKIDLADRVRSARAGVMERRTDEGPDIGSYLDLIRRRTQMARQPMPQQPAGEPFNAAEMNRANSERIRQQLLAHQRPVQSHAPGPAPQRGPDSVTRHNDATQSSLAARQAELARRMSGGSAAAASLQGQVVTVGARDAGLVMSIEGDTAIVMMMDPATGEQVLRRVPVAALTPAQ